MPNRIRNILRTLNESIDPNGSVCEEDGFSTFKPDLNNTVEHQYDDEKEPDQTKVVESMTPINKQMQTERGLVYVVGSYSTTEDANKDGFEYAWRSSKLGNKRLFSRLGKDINHREFAIVDESIDDDHEYRDTDGDEVREWARTHQKERYQSERIKSYNDFIQSCKNNGITPSIKLWKLYNNTLKESINESAQASNSEVKQYIDDNDIDGLTKCLDKMKDDAILQDPYDPNHYFKKADNGVKYGWGEYVNDKRINVVLWKNIDVAKGLMKTRRR